jgi:hypothetical protein
MNFKIVVIPFMVVFGGVLVTGGFHDGFFDFMWKTFLDYMMFFSVMAILIAIAVMVARFFRRFQAVEQNVKELDQRVVDLEGKMDRRFEMVDRRFEVIEMRLDKMDARFDRLEDKISRIMELLIERKG